MIAPPNLEIAVLVLGMMLLILEAVSANIDKRVFVFAGILGLITVLIGTFYLAPVPPIDQPTGFWSFYTADPLSIFFKRFALVTTILIIIMMIDYAPSVRGAIAGCTQQAGLGEFFALPVLTCAGLMYLVSAIDFIMIFVSLELVTISFYVLVSFTRKNPLLIEVGEKTYLFP